MKNLFSHKTIWIFLTGLMMVGIVVTGTAIGSAQTPQMATMQNPPKVWIVEGESSANPVKNLPPKEFLLKAPQTANITVTYVGSWDAQAQAAFEYAVSIWETQITSPIEIKVEAKWGNLGSGVLGGAGTASLMRDFPNAPVANTFYPVALANKLAGSDLFTSQEDCDGQEPINVAGPDICATFNSAYSGWYFGTNGTPPNNLIDFASVVLHEIGHGLGFFGTMSASSNICNESGIGCWGYGYGFPSIYDRFTENGTGTPLLNFPNYSSELGTQLLGSVYFNGPNANAANGNSRVPLVTLINGGWQQGSSYSHLAESFNGTANALMTYSIGPGEANHNPGPVMLGMFTDMGWSISAPTPTPTKTLTPTPKPTCVPVIGITPNATAVGSETSYLPLIQNYVNCLPPTTPTLTPTATATSTGGYSDIYFDNFEGTFPGPWQLSSFGATGGFDWGKSNCRGQNSTNSAWGIGGGSSGQGYPCGSDYPLNIENWMTYGPFSTSGLTAAYMTFGTWFNTEVQYDKICYLASGVGGTNPYDYDGYCWSGDSQTVDNNIDGWVQEFLNIGNIYGDGTVNLLGDSTVWVTFVFLSDELYTYPTGAFVDNVWLRGCVSGCGLDMNASQPSADTQKLPWKEVLAAQETAR